MTGATAAIPNLLTGARLVLSIAMWLCLAGAASAVPWLSDQMTGDMQFAAQRWAFWLFVAAAVTDFFDGLLARRWGVESLAGEILDPIADKILVCGAILGLLSTGAFQQDAQNFVVPAALILFREFAVSALREVTAARGVRLPVTTLAKWKTTIQLVAIGASLFATVWGAFGLPQDDPDLLNAVVRTAHILMWVAAAVTIWTGIEYGLAARRALKAQPRKAAPK